METLSNLLSPATPAFSFDSPPTLLFFLSILSLLLPLRLLSALLTPIQDCDEAYNYWEPTHFLLHGHGMQTWEYSPTYALRSYLYLALHVLAIKAGEWTGAVHLLGGGKVGEFYFLRAVLACVSALCEAWLVHAIASRMRRSIAVTTAALLALTAGMFHASIAYLPSTFCMYGVMLVYASWMRSEYAVAVFFTGVSALIGWPFAGLLSLPLALDIAWRYLTRIHLPITWAVLTAAICLTPSLLLDYHYYHRLLLAVLNIALYNSQHSAGSGSTLYGTEPASYYANNLALNFNLAAPLAAAGPPLALLFFARWRSGKHAAFLLWSAGWVLWLAAMLVMPHKEERFLFIVYPLLCFSAAYAMVHLVLTVRQYFCCARRGGVKQEEEEDEEVLSPRFQEAVKVSSPLGRGSIAALTLGVAVIGLLSAARVAALIVYYGAPLHVYAELSRRVEGVALNPFADASSTAATSNPFADKAVCVGKEWYRFPSHFFLPSPSVYSNVTTTYHLQYLPSSFSGLLPGHFQPSPSTSSSLSSIYHDRALSTRLIPPHQNHLNQAEPSRYVEMATCDWVVDLVLEGQREGEYRVRRVVKEEVGGCRVEWVWRVVGRWRFLDAERSARWSRTLYIPYASDTGNRWGEYQLLEREEERTCS